MTEPFAANLIHFVRYLRASGLSVVPHTTVDLLEATEAVGLERREDVYHAFRAVTVVRPDELDAFDEAFELFFGTGDLLRTRPPELLELKVHDRDRLRVAIPVLRSEGPEQHDADTKDAEEELGASAADRLGERDFGDMTPEEQAEVRRLIAQMMWKPADAYTRRWAPARRGPRPHLRRTLRRVVRHEGDLLPLALAQRRPRRRPLLVLADVSGSMERYSEMLLYFIHAAHGRLGRTEAFVFSTRLTRITREIRHRDPRIAIRRVADTVPDWSGGTRIGEALETFNHAWSRQVTRGGPVALIISDGWDTGDPGLLRDEMGRFARSVHRVVWLNPLAGRPDYRPETRGMRAVLPFVDDFLAAASLADLAAVVRLLESVPSRRREVARR